MIRHLLNASVDVYRPTFTSDGRGGLTRETSKVGTIRARVMHLPRQREEYTGGRMGDVLTDIVHALPDADVRRGDELDDGSARRLRVVSVVLDSGRTYKRIDCQELQGA
jgi:hypothetical protein